MRTIIFFTFIFILIMVILFIAFYNKLIHMIEAVLNNKKQIDIQLDRRFKVYESLIEVVKKYMDYEKTTLKEVVSLRNQAQKAAVSGLSKERMEAENKISEISGGLKVIFEQYPNLKADKNALQLQEEIVNTENKLAFAKQAYNDSIERYNATRKSFIEAMVVGLMPRKLYREFAYWGVSEEKRATHEEYRVRFRDEDKE